MVKMAMSRAFSAPALIFAVLVPCAAQSLQDQLSKAPPEVDQRLRERISEFYQYHVDRKFRLAEKLVAEDTKEFFFEQKKKTILKFDIKEIQYSDDFTKAKATVICEQHVMIPGFAGKPMGIPVPSYWKLEDKDWYWYVDPDRLAETPFGVMKRPDPSSPAQENIDITSAINSAPDVEAIQKGVQADKDKVVLAPGREKDQVTLANLLPGKLTLSLHVPPVKGLSAALAKSELAGKERTTLHIAVDPAAPITKPVLLRITAMPMNKVLYVLVSYEKPGAAK